jgi:restriction system protein
MSFPKQSEIELPLLKTLHELGGKAEPKEIYPKIAAIFPQLTEDDLTARLSSSPSTFRWHNLVQWSRQKLVEKGEIDGSTRGVWKLTARGRARATGASANLSEELLLAHQATLKDLVYENEAEVKARITSELRNLGAAEFEQFCISFLGPLGYEQLQVTKRGADRGIDGHGLFRQGVVSIRSAFQAKRWRQNSVTRPEIDKFRGAIQGDYDHGVFLTTGRFTADAEAASIKKGAISLLLLDGDAIAESMIRNGIGVVRRPVQLFDLDPDFFRFPAADAFL